MSAEILEQQLTELQQRVELLERRTFRRSGNDWHEIVGTSNGDELDREAAAMAEAWRKSENQRR